jgi:hypothetical protein
MRGATSTAAGELCCAESLEINNWLAAWPSWREASSEVVAWEMRVAREAVLHSTCRLGHSKSPLGACTAAAEVVDVRTGHLGSHGDWSSP